MTNPNDAAFPNEVEDEVPGTKHPIMIVGGLTKLEYFAAMAMSGDLAEQASSDRGEFWIECARSLIDALNKHQEKGE